VSLFTALAMIGLHRLKGIDTRAVIVHFALVGLLFAIAAFFLFERRKPLVAPSARQLLLLAGVGLSATVGQLFLTLAFTHGEPAKVSVVGLTQIIFALLLDAVVLGHYPDASNFIGVPLIIAPTAWLMLRRHPVHGEPLPPEPLETPAPE
jgi:drug/metabolite transporter (DMT)-like permease